VWFIDPRHPVTIPVAWAVTISFTGNSRVSGVKSHAMNKETVLDEHRAGDKFVHFIDWLNHKLVGTLGPPNVGPYNAVVERVGEALCPVCDRPMLEHAIDHTASNPVLNCPVDHLPERAKEGKLNELGMPKHLL
jgi:hypothetical protein